MAGINAACAIKDLPPVVLRRTDGYTGILIDDLITKGVDEPYRMFTSRAEFRLHLRIDNADARLTPIAIRLGLATEDRKRLFEAKQAQKALLDAALERAPSKLDWLKQTGNRISGLMDWIRPLLGEEPARGLLDTVETEVKYAGYIAQQDRQIARLRTSERRNIPSTFCFKQIPGLSCEVQQKLERVRPSTLGQAGRIPGVTPAAVAILDVYLSLPRLES